MDQSPKPPSSPQDVQTHQASKPDYVWTPVRIITGILVVLVGAALPGWVLYHQFYGTPLRIGRKGLSTAMPARYNANPLDQFDLSNLQIKKEKILSGGPRKDGIPSLRTEKATPPPNAKPSAQKASHPARIVHANQTDFLTPDARVVGLVVNGEARAYPIAVLNWHEAINDQLGQTPIAVIYCPLCDSISVVDRRIAGKTLELGISGLLANSNVLLYDRVDQALWSQVKLTAISGPLAGQSLKHLGNWQITSRDQWIKEHPDTTFVSFETGYRRRYSVSPYASYFATDRLMFPVVPTDSRMPHKTPVIGILDSQGQTKAYTLAAILESPGGVLEDQIQGKPLRLKATRHPLSVQVAQIPKKVQVVYTFWFAWYAYHPKTKLVRSKKHIETLQPVAGITIDSHRRKYGRPATQPSR